MGWIEVLQLHGFEGLPLDGFEVRPCPDGLEPRLARWIRTKVMSYGFDLTCSDGGEVERLHGLGGLQPDGYEVE